jgi:uncharacterized beta-barrel protein YwiB (DUF1934 family)
MKKQLLSLFLMLFSTTIMLAQNIKKLDEKNGFKEITLGSFHQDVKQYLAPEPDEVNEAEKTATYKVTDASFFVVGESEISSIQVQFFKDKVASILLETKGLQNSKALLKALTMAYGNGEKRNTYIEEYHWNGKKVLMSYKMNGASKNTIISISSKDLLESSEKYNKDSKKNVTKEL